MQFMHHHILKSVTQKEINDRDTVEFEKRAYTLVYEWRKCDITMPATATSAIATAASADADADGFSAAYLRSCRNQYCGAGVLLLSRDRRKPQNLFWVCAGPNTTLV